MCKIDFEALSQKGRAQTRLLVVQIKVTLAVVGETNVRNTTSDPQRNVR